MNIFNENGIVQILNHREHEKPRVCLVFEILQ